MVRESASRQVVVVGAGPAGSATAALLAEAGHQVLLVDKARFPRPKPCAEYVSPGAERLLARLGLLGRVGRGLGRRLRGMEIVAPGGERFLVEYGPLPRLLPYEGRGVRLTLSDDCPAGSLFPGREGGRGVRSEETERLGQAPEIPTGFALPRFQFDAALLDAARARGVEVWEGFRVASVLVDDRAVQGIVGSGPDGRTVVLRSRLLIGADGRQSVVARDLRLRRPVRWPRRLGLVAHYRGVPWPLQHGRMYVGRHGYVGAAPLGDDLVGVGLVMPLPRDALGPTAAALDLALAQYPELGELLAGARPVGPVQGVGPLAHSVRSCVGDGYLLVGDAAGFFDPFTGEGIYRALRGAELAAGVADATLREDDVTACGLSRYAALRAREFGAKERLTHLVQVFVQRPRLMDYAIARLRSRPQPAGALSLALGDLLPAERVLRPGALWSLLKP